MCAVALYRVLAMCIFYIADKVVRALTMFTSVHLLGAFKKP